MDKCHSYTVFEFSSINISIAEIEFINVLKINKLYHRVRKAVMHQEEKEFIDLLIELLGLHLYRNIHLLPTTLIEYRQSINH